MDVSTEADWNVRAVPMLRAMRYSSLLALAALSSACATRTNGDLPFNLASTHTSWAPTPTADPVTADPVTGASATGASATGEPAPAAPVAPKLFGGEGYTRFSLGTFDPTGDIEGLDTGYYAQVAFGSDVIRFLAVDVSLGYASADGPGDTELRVLPLFINGRAQLPITIFELYAGLGVGGMWADYDFGVGNDDSEFVLAGTAFLGGEVGLGKLALGLEYRYLTSEETDRNFAIEGHCGLITLTLPF